MAGVAWGGSAMAGDLGWGWAQGVLGRVGWGQPTGLQGPCGGGGQSLAQEMETRAQATTVGPGQVEGARRPGPGDGLPVSVAVRSWGDDTCCPPLPVVHSCSCTHASEDAS